VQRSSSSRSSPQFELKLVVDDKERSSDTDYHKIYSSIRQEHMRLQQLPAGTTVRCVWTQSTSHAVLHADDAAY
jgi:plastocyanin